MVDLMDGFGANSTRRSAADRDETEIRRVKSEPTLLNRDLEVMTFGTAKRGKQLSTASALKLISAIRFVLYHFTILQLK